MIGKALGHYAITSQLGKGGMGEVYQAKDQKLGRDVAIKILPEEFAKDADRVARFQREAKVLASLNHPNIAAIYGLEESSGTNFLVLELVEGQTLADRIKAGPIPVEEALKVALQIAEALEAAHEKGVIHRDLKPANIKVTPEGKVKVLDFGLAKAFAGEQAEMNLSNSPTLSDAATQQGIILGTAAYMSPEQASGKTIDKRADIWAFGVVLFEMLTGRSLFAGDSVPQTLARVLQRQPDFSLLPQNLHFKVVELLKRCLQKESRNRYHDIADIRLDLQEVLAGPSGVLVQPITGVEPRNSLRKILPWIAAVLVLGLIIAGVAVWNLRKPEPKRVMRFTYDLPEGQQLVSWLAVSPDGSLFVYGTTEGLYLRAVDTLDARLIAGTDKDSRPMPFFSPDGKWIGYWSQSDHKLKKVAISGGTPEVLCETGLQIVGASWDLEDTIVYADINSGIMRVSANGGIPESLIKGGRANIKEGLYIYPQMLPDGKTLLLTNASGVTNNPTDLQILVHSLKSGKQKVLLKGGLSPKYLSAGYLTYVSVNNNTANLLAVPFDLDKLEVMGGAVPIIENVGPFDVSNSGTAVYLQSPPRTTQTFAKTLVWVDRKGKEQPLRSPLKDYRSPRISPDGTKLALEINENSEKSDIWIWDLVRESLMRLTHNEDSHVPVWTPDGRRVAFCSYAQPAVYWKAADGTGADEKLGSLSDAIIMYAWSFSSDGKVLLTEDAHPATTWDIGALSMEGDHKWKPLLQGKYWETGPTISPDGRWMAYASNESEYKEGSTGYLGQQEVFVCPFPEVNKERWQVSTNGGDTPLWLPNGRELFYRNGDSYMAVPV